MRTLIILHNIHLSKNEIKSLVKREPVKVIGTSVPVWFYKGTTSEPALEVFCEYILTNQEPDYSIITNEKGYQINLPQLQHPETWAKFSSSEKEEWLKRYQQLHSFEATMKNVETLSFKKITKAKHEGKINLVHVVEISPIEILTSALT